MNRDRIFKSLNPGSMNIGEMEAELPPRKVTSGADGANIFLLAGIGERDQQIGLGEMM